MTLLLYPKLKNPGQYQFDEREDREPEPPQGQSSGQNANITGGKLLSFY